MKDQLITDPTHAPFVPVDDEPGIPAAVAELFSNRGFDIPAKKPDVKPAADELSAGMDAWQAQEKPIPVGYLERYAELVTSANTGAVFKTRTS